MKPIKSLYIIFFLAHTLVSIAQVGINTTNPDNSAALEIKSNTQGVLIPRMTQVQRDAINTPAAGLLIYQNDASAGFYYYNGNTWIPFAGSGNGWELTGNSGTNPSINAIGTSDNQGLSIVTNNTEAIRISSTGYVGMGTSSPTAKLHLNTNTNQTLTILDGLQGNDKVLVSDENGIGVWKSKTLAKTEDNDWFFDNGFNNLHPIYHIGNVKIGSTSPSTYNLHVTNGATSGTKVYLGDSEYILDATNDFEFSHRIIPISGSTPNLGSSTNRWNTTYVGSGGFISTSDARLKTNITTLNIGLKEILHLNPVSFHWKNEKFRNHEVPQNQKELKLGFIAQEIQTVLPEIVKTREWKEYEETPGALVQEEMPVIGVNYNEMIPVLVKAIQEQNNQINTLKEKINHLKSRINLLKKQSMETK
ncbi:tail fiber domain-containing protein [Flavobacterium chuncheonense]|uniref:Tail fiber domain-containing protein n=1 Tax=Flavobacterium chuncheonense TaxID=2026653 RepID=A0ABW5YKU3_9FLAO